MLFFPIAHVSGDNIMWFYDEGLRVAGGNCLLFPCSFEMWVYRFFFSFVFGEGRNMVGGVCSCEVYCIDLVKIHLTFSASKVKGRALTSKEGQPC